MKANVPRKYLKAPFPWFGGKQTVIYEVWKRFGRPTQYIEPFCGTAAVLLAAPQPASLEVICDANYYVANFWRCIKFQPDAVYEWQDYPVSHVDLDARHRWLTQPERCAKLREQLADAEWAGDAQIAGWWVWGQCCWIGSGWCEKESQVPHATSAGQGVQSKVPHAGNAGRGVQSQVPHASDAGMGVQSQVPHAGNAGRGVQSKVSPASDAGMGVKYWFSYLAQRLERVRINHGDWSRCLNHHYGGKDTAIFFDPPYVAFERLYHKDGQEPVAKAVEAWCKENTGIRVALCGLLGDYDLPGWEVMPWKRGRLTYGGSGNGDKECIWFSPECFKVSKQGELI